MKSELELVTPDKKPPVGGFGGSIHDWERSLDPWHVDAFPDRLKWAAIRSGARRNGWMALDAFGTQIAFVADGDRI